MNQYIYVRPRDDGQGWAVDVYDGRRAWAKTHLGERPLNKAEAHRVAHKLRDPKFYSGRTKRAVNRELPHADLLPGERIDFKKLKPTQAWCRCGNAIPCRKHEGVVEARVGTMPGSGIPLPHPPDEPFCACGRRLSACDGSRAGCTGQTGMPGVRDTKNPCDMFSPGKPTNGGCQGDGHYLCRECGLFDERSES